MISNFYRVFEKYSGLLRSNLVAFGPLEKKIKYNIQQFMILWKYFLKKRMINWFESYILHPRILYKHNELLSLHNFLWKT